MLREMKAAVSRRVKGIVVLYAFLYLGIAIAQAVLPNSNVIGGWLDSYPLQIGTFLVFWLVSPLLNRWIFREKEER